MAGSADKIRIYREMLKLDPKSRVYALLAEELCEAGKWEEAAEVCRKGLRFHPDHFRSRVLLGWALMELGEVDESGRALMDIYDEVRRNSVMFKLLSEFATFSGDENRAAEFTRIYDALHVRECIPAGPEAQVRELQSTREATSQEAPDSESAPEDKLGVEDIWVPDEKPEAERSNEAVEKLEKILSGLAERVESRISGVGAAPEVLSEKDKDFIKQRILSEIGAAS
jgi:tetratricopeptide (TPR) repeat protein